MAQSISDELRYKQMFAVLFTLRRWKLSNSREDSRSVLPRFLLFSSQRYVFSLCNAQLNLSFTGLKGKLFGGVKVKRARSFSGREKQKWSPSKDIKEGKLASLTFSACYLSTIFSAMDYCWE